MQRKAAWVLTLIAMCNGVAVPLVLFTRLKLLTDPVTISHGRTDFVAMMSAFAPVDVPLVMTMQMSRVL